MASMTNADFMDAALVEARAAGQAGEVPIGAVVVFEGRIVATGQNSVLRTLGSDLAAGQEPQLTVPAGVWQGTRLVEGGAVALLGCTVAPGFDFADYRGGSFADLVGKWPAETERIRALTRR